MTGEDPTTQEIISELDVFNDCLDTLTVDLIKTDLETSKVPQTRFPDFQEESQRSEIGEADIQQSAWLASALASSDDDSHKRKALSFAILAYLRYQETEREDLYKRYLYIVLSRVGNLPAFNNVHRAEGQLGFRSQLMNSLDSVLSLELESDLNEYELDEGRVLSEFQKRIYELLLEGKNVAISGPTSSGKSFVLKQYIDHQVKTEEGFEAIYVVPTRALISEVSRDLSDRYDSIEVRTGAYFEEDTEQEDSDKDTFLVVTPERCLQLIDPETRQRINPSLVFLDEVQNVEEDQRGVLFESIIESLTEYYPTAQVVAAGPYLENPGETLSSLTQRDVEEVTTAFTPVLQIKATLRFFSQSARTDRGLELTVHSPTGNKETIQIEEPSSMTYSEVKGNKKKSIRKILEAYGEDTKNLVYSARKDYAEDRAEHIAEHRSPQTVDSDVRGLIEFLAEAIHEEYSLIKCLRRGVAYHHGMVPKIAREEMEELYREGEFIDTIVTTPTLMQGVNLPAEKIFLVSANRGSDELSDFEFNNLIGRVGRLDTKLYGAIYCIESEGDEWADEKLEKADKKEIKSATSKATDDAEQLISALGDRDLSQVEDDAVRYTAVLLRGRYLKNPDTVRPYLDEKGFSKQEIDAAQTELETLLETISIPESILRKNPTVDPIKQDLLYKNLQRSSEPWIVASNRHEYSYQQFEQVTRRLNEIFKFTNDSERSVETKNTETENASLGTVIYAGNEWLQGYKYNSIIKGRQKSEKIDDGDIQTSIRKALETVRTDIRFVLVKYYGILADLLEAIDEEVPDWMLRFDQMLEMGSMRYEQIRLMSLGVDRSVAVTLHIPENIDDVVTYLQENQHALAPFHRRHLENQGIL